MTFKGNKVKFKNMQDSKQITEYLKRVLERPGTKKKYASLYHYTNIESVLSIINSKCIWLGPTACMNDYIENECLKNSNMFFASFSKVEENMGMYKMYAPNPNGVMLKMNYLDAEKLVNRLSTKDNKRSVRIVRDNILTEDTVYADVYWSAVAYKELHSNMIIADSVKNKLITNPLCDNYLAGFIKLYGWEYEKEVRLCAILDEQLERNEKIAIEFPEDMKISVVTGPGFDKGHYKREYMQLCEKGVDVRNSCYNDLVNLDSKTNETRQINEDDIEEIISNSMRVEPNETGNTLIIDPRYAIDKWKKG